MNAEDAGDYVGLPYLEGGETPDGFNCWGFLRYVLAKHFNKVLPAIPLGDGPATRAIHAEALAQARYFPVVKPAHGDAALLRGGDSPHVGIWLDFDGGGVLHSMEGIGVIWTPRNALNMLGFGRATYYRIN